MKPMPTTKELIKRINQTSTSVAYQESRTILNNLDQPLLAYSLGFAGFIGIFVDNKGKGYPKAFCYFAKSPAASWGNAGFSDIDIDRALAYMKDPLFKEHRTDTRKLNKFLTKQKFLRPTLGIMKYKEREQGHIQVYIIQQKRNKKYRVMHKYRESYSKAHLDNARSFIQEFTRAEAKYKKVENGETIQAYELIENTIPQEHIDKIKHLVFLEEM